MKPSILLSGRPEAVWWWLLLRKCHSVGSKFDGKQCREQFITPLSCLPQSRCNYLAFRTPVLLRLLHDHDTYNGADPLGVFPLFQRMVADIIAPKLSIIFHGVIRRGSFPKCWLSANVTVIPKGAQSPDKENYLPISITPVLSKVYEKLVFYKLSSCWENMFFCLLLNLLTRKVWAALITISHHFRSIKIQGWSLILRLHPSTLVLPSIE